MKVYKAKHLQIMGWYKKYIYLQEFIGKLEHEGETGSIIAAFMLNSQLIEYRLKKEINLLRHYINMHMHNKSICLKTGEITKIENDKQTLGSLIKELDKYDGDLLADLKKILKELLHYRNRFTHKLFNMDTGSTTDIRQSALNGNILANKAWDALEQLSYITSGDYENEKYGD